jgi:stage III sporulation protein AF
MHAIQFLGGWFKQIILVVLLAVFLEFLLPSQTMQKYARLVMGMVLVSVMLIPIAKILHIDMNTVEEQVLQFLQQSQASDSLTDIYQKANEIKQSEQSQTIEEWKQHIEDELKQQIQDQFAVQVRTLDLNIASQKEQTMPVIRSVSLDIDQIQKNNSQKTVGQDSHSDSIQGIRIAPVQPVQSVGDFDSKPVQGNTDMTSKTLSKLEQSLQQQIGAYLQQQFHLSMDSIHITFEDAARG